jgi:steroid delta-isomerase-like uncharacterized protein
MLATLALATIPAVPSAGATSRVAGQRENCAPPTAAEAEAIARGFIAAFNVGDANALDALLAPESRHQGTDVAVQDREQYKQRQLALREGFPDGAYTLDWVIVDGDTVAMRYSFRGTHAGRYEGVAATGRPVAVGILQVLRVACGQIAESATVWDAVGLFQQVGAIPGPVTTPATQEARAPATTTGASCPATTPAQNAAQARRWYDEALNQDRFEVLDDLLAENIVHHGGVLVDLVGREAVAGGLRAILNAFPDWHSTVDAVVAGGDTVLIRWSARGTQLGPFVGVPASGNVVDWSGMNAFRFACGVVIESWSEVNGLEFLRQTGAPSLPGDRP